MLGSRLLRSFMENRRYNAAERIMMCALIALSGTFFYYDYYQSFADIARIVITVLIFVVWFYCALCAGKDKQWGFIIFGYLYWVVPYIYMVYYNSRDNVRGYSKWLSLFNKIADMIFVKPFEFVAGKLEIDPVALACVVLGGTTFLFIGGFLMRFFYERKSDTPVKEFVVHEKVNREQKPESTQDASDLKDFLGF